MSLHFEPICLEKQERYLSLWAACPQKTSDYSFVNLWGWSEEYALSWAWQGDLVWIRQTKPQVCLWAPVGPWGAVDWDPCLAESVDGPAVFTRVPGDLVQIWQNHLGGRVQRQESRGHWDYLYHVADLVELKGNRLHKKKNLLNQFTKNYDFTYIPLEAETTHQALSMQTDWCNWRDCESFEILASENHVIEKVLHEWNAFKGLLGGALLVGDKMVAYTVGERLSDQTVLIHFEKGHPDYKGVYQAINQMFAAHLSAEILFVNREQDLNDEGLRRAKLSYQPANFLRKYQVAISG
ncbi:MAG: phosphatidylglycerol lysyltransferase domain-containing protein [Desulfobacterales bacterium]|nr:phosphatidylglycerol lysyltransferase domain-containing protein [Desulfobacterales bacterium]